MQKLPCIQRADRINFFKQFYKTHKYNPLNLYSKDSFYKKKYFLFKNCKQQKSMQNVSFLIVCTNTYMYSDIIR